MFKRSSGVLMHITSLPSIHGIGSLGKAAMDFVDFMADAGQTYWQVLPLGHTGFGESPYQCYSAAAGNPLLIDLDELCEMGLLIEKEIGEIDERISKSHDQVDFEQARIIYEPTLRHAVKRIDEKMRKKIDEFCKENASWIDDYAMFMAIRDHFNEKPLWEWEDKAILAREDDAMQTYSCLLAEHIQFYRDVQYIFFTQWEKIRKYANEKGIQIIGDIPIYVSPDSSDVWANPKLFKLSDDLSPNKIAGVPPDYYSEIGQLWGNPVYDWDEHEKDDFAWWEWRMKENMKLFDVIRIDHFRGLAAYWEVDSGEENAIKGKWQKGPGMKLFNSLIEKLGELPIIAEDLGVQTEEVRELLEASGYFGMRVLIFGFDANGDSDHLPHNYLTNSIVYTSTHDSQTICEEVMDLCNAENRQFAYDYLRSSTSEALGWSAIKAVFASNACIAMTTMQDILSLGADARMNTPATVGNNWRWRVRADALNEVVSSMLYKITKTYKR